MVSVAVVPMLIPILGAAGFVSGLAGFAFSGVAAVTLFVLPPTQAVPLLLCLSIANQLMSASSLWHQMRILPRTGGEEVALPYLLGGLLGVPVGLELLHKLSASAMASLLGSFLVVFSLVVLALPALPRIRSGGSAGAILTGWLGGVVGGFSAFPGAVPSAYLALRHMNKAEARGVLQPYIMGMQFLAIAMLVARRPALFSRDFLLLFLASLPPVLVGALAGVRCYHRLGDHDFRRLVLVLLAISGGALLARQYFS